MSGIPNALRYTELYLKTSRKTTHWYIIRTSQKTTFWAYRIALRVRRYILFDVYYARFLNRGHILLGRIPRFRNVATLIGRILKTPYGLFVNYGGNIPYQENKYPPFVTK